MCTDDADYQRFRRIIRLPWLKKILLALPQKWRRKIAADMRAASKRRKREIGLSPISDVSEYGVQTALKQYPQTEILIHGHTHRPAVHSHTFGGRTISRYVLPDWHGKEGGYLSVSERGCTLHGLPAEKLSGGKRADTCLCPNGAAHCTACRRKNKRKPERHWVKSDRFGGMMEKRISRTKACLIGKAGLWYKPRFTFSEVWS